MPEAKKFTRKQLNAAMEEAFRRFGGRDDVTAVDIGYRWDKGKPTKQVCVRVHVREKIPLSALETADVFPGEIEGVTLDVIQGNYQTHRATQSREHAARFPVLLGGISIGHPDVTAGTLGGLVIDNSSGLPAILSNWHVLVGPSGRPGDNILQPGSADRGQNPRDSVAILGQSILDRDGDAAIAILNGNRPWLPYIFGSFIHPKGARDSILGEVLVKSGRTTAQTQARVDGEGIFKVAYKTGPRQEETKYISGFKLVSVTVGNPENEELSSGGDSGCLWTDPKDGEAVGLHFAGETDPRPRKEHAIACNMTSVLRRLDVRLATAEDLMTFATGGSHAAVGNSSHATDGVTQSATELTLPPDWPRPPKFPWPPNPPWPPGGPFCPQCGDSFGGEVPWPLGAGDQDLLNLKDPNNPLDTLAPETVAAKTVSLRQYIWPHLKAALVAKNGNFSTAAMGKRLDAFMPATSAAAIVSSAANNSAQYQNDGVITRSTDFRRDVTFGHAAGSIGSIYRALGFTVVT